MEKKDKETLRKYAYVISSEVRRKIMIALAKKPLTPTQIAEETELNLSQVSRNLKSLREKELVELINPEDKKGRLYRLKEDGEWIVKKDKE